MNSKGWSLQRQSANSDQAAENKAEVEAAIKAQREKQSSMCADPKFAPYFDRTTCTPDKLSFEQLADTSKISPDTKAIFSQLRASIDSSNRELMDLMRKYGGTVGARRADLYSTTAKVDNDQNNLRLYSGQITWGEYNRRRQEIAREYLAAFNKITS
jgi:hypothetical protein